MAKMCVWVREVGVLSAKGDRIVKWEIWEAFNTLVEAKKDWRHDLNNLPSWETVKFFKNTNRIRKYVPEKES